MNVFVVLLVAAALATAVPLAGLATLAWPLGLRITRIAFGLGPTLARVPLGRVTLDLRPVPLASAMTFAGSHDELRGARPFDRLGRAEKIAMALSSCVAGIVVAAALLGPSAALQAAAASWGEFFAVVSAFPHVAAPWWPIMETVRTASFVTVLGLACAKVAGLNLLPLLPLNGGMAIMYLLGWDAEGSPGEKLASACLKISVIALLVIVALWLIGGVRFVLAGG